MIAKPTVFVVDDDQAIREQLSFTAGSAGYGVETFASAEAFLDAYQADRPGCLVLDIRMAGMDGLELQARLNEMNSILPIIMISGHGDIPMAVQSIQAGAIDFLEKPFREQALLDCIRAAVKRNDEARRAMSARSDIDRRLSLLTPREREVLELIVAGKSNKLIAAELSISHKTVESHRTKIMDKMNAMSPADLTRMVLTGTTSDES